MRRLVPYPLLSGSLLIMWLLLNQTLSAQQVLLGCVLGLVAPWGLVLLEPPPVRIRRPDIAARLFCVVLADVIASNIAVARIILSPGAQKHTAGFVRIPLEMRNPYGLAVLACIITATPGTLWVSFESATATLTIHVLDLVDEDVWIKAIKRRYERPLLEIFQ